MASQAGVPLNETHQGFPFLVVWMPHGQHGTDEIFWPPPALRLKVRL
ncbi:MAG: hypothetical protein ACO1QB_11855 [Verrucomicrobiales bacterium]